eukprot:TRINITY_DN7140_c1_g2_i1.p1 TRINITY_DN7140_c1_g2~~TRINITY_DN7140_c1_g2_i1.p1  ORF type:complete len:2361 (-),score=382.91 TRINITY_DN7140_c1_g2_i1:110-7192(-)
MDDAPAHLFSQHALHLVPSKAASSGTSTPKPDESDAWRQKQLEIKQLQEANRTLLRKVTSSSSQQGSPGSAARAGALLLEADEAFAASNMSCHATTSAGRRDGGGSSNASAAVTTVAPYLPVPAELDFLTQYSAQSTPYIGSIPSSFPQTPDILMAHRGDLGEENRRLAREISASHAQLLELRREAALRDRELREWKLAADKLREAQARLEEADKRNEDLTNENLRLQTAKELIEKLQTADGSVVHKMVRSYIENDFESMREERRKAEALLRARVTSWEEQSARWKAECSSLEEEATLATERHRMDEAMRSRTSYDVEDRCERQLSEWRHEATASRAALVEAQRRLAGSTEELRAADARAATAAAAGAAARREFEAQRVMAERRRSEYSALEQRAIIQEETATQERMQLQDALQHHEESAADERKRWKRDASKRTSELQTRGGELREETEELAAKAKEAERTMHAKLSAARQDKQRAEARLNRQVQALQAELATQVDESALAKESEELAERLIEAGSELQLLRNEYRSLETEHSSQRQRHTQTIRSLRGENEAMQQKMQAIDDQSKQAVQSELLEERRRYQEEAWQRVSSVEGTHSKQVTQLQESQAQELELVNERMRLAQGEADRRHAALQAQLTAEEQAAAKAIDEVMQLRRLHADACEELTQAKADGQSIAQQHEALVTALKREHTMADSHFQTLLRQAEEKQRRLGQLQGEALSDDGGADLPQSPEVAGSISTAATALVKPPRSALITPRSALSTVRSLEGAEVSIKTQNCGDGVDNVLRALARENASRRAHKIGNDIGQLLGDAAAIDESGLEDESVKNVPLAKRPALMRQLVQELIGLHDQANQSLAEEEIRFAAGRDREAQLRANVDRADSRLKAHKTETAEKDKARAEAHTAALQALEVEHGDKLQKAEVDFRDRLLGAEARSGALLAGELAEAERVAAIRFESERTRAAESLQALETRAAQDVNRVETAASEQRHAVLAELAELRRTLDRELVSTREEHAAQAKREARLESKCETLVEDCARADAEKQKASETLDSARRELAAAGERHEETEAVLANKIASHREENAQLEESIQELENGGVPKWEMQQFQEERRKMAEKQRKLARQNSQRMEDLRLSEEHVEMAIATSQEQWSAELNELRDREAKLKRELIAVREEKNKEKTRSDKIAKQLRGRIQELESYEESVAKKHHHEQLSYRRSAEEVNQKLALQRRHSVTETRDLQERLDQQEKNTLEEEELAQELRDSLVISEGRCQELERFNEDLEHSAGKTSTDWLRREAGMRSEIAEISTELSSSRLSVDADKSKVAELLSEQATLERKTSSLEADLADRTSVLTTEMAAARKESHAAQGEVRAARLANERLRKAVESEALGVLPLLPDLAVGEAEKLRAALFQGAGPTNSPAIEGASVGWTWEVALAFLFNALSDRMRVLEQQCEETKAQAKAASQALSAAEKLAGRKFSRSASPPPHTSSAPNSPGRGPQRGNMSRSSTKGSRSPTKASRCSVDHEDVSTARGGAAEAHQSARSESAGKLALLQKELYKLREENQDLKLEQKRLTERARASADCVGRLEDARNKSKASNASVVHSPGAGGSAGEASKVAVAFSQPQMELRQKLRQAQKDKARVDSEVASLKLELTTRCQPLKETIEKLNNELWEFQQQKEAEDESSRHKTQVLERRVRILEGKLQERAETCRNLSAEKDSIEEQLNGAVRQLEALLAEEHKDGDLQRDLAGLSKQFELLHSKHRAQLARAAEQTQHLQQERTLRRELEGKLRDASNRLDLELSEVGAKHEEQVSVMLEQASALRRRSSEKDRELQEALSEQATLLCEVSKSKSVHQSQALVIQELQDEMKRLEGEVERNHMLLAEARQEHGPTAQRQLAKERESAAELIAARQNLEQVRSTAESLTSENMFLKATMRELESELSVENKRQQSKVVRQEESEENLASLSTSACSGGSKQDRYSEQNSAVMTSSRDTGINDKADRPVRVRTAHGGDFDAQSPSLSQTVSAPSAGTKEDDFTSAFEEIQRTLRARERALHAQSASGSGGGLSSTAEATVDTTKRENREPARTPASISTRDDSSMPCQVDASESKVDELEVVQRDFVEYARSLGFEGDVSTVWEEARARARAEATSSPSQSRPIAADVQLKAPSARLPPDGSYPQSPPSRGSAYPSEAAGSGGYPTSPGRGEGWLSSLRENDNGGRVAESSPQYGGLPPFAEEVYHSAESLTEQQNFADAVPRFRRVLQIIESEGLEASVRPSIIAEVHAHLGVSLQSLDRVPEAIDSYKRAVLLDPALHVCFANLATLHSYINDHERAIEYIHKALSLDPKNSTYHTIKQSFETPPASAAQE